jgi:hypothetical protein
MMKLVLPDGSVYRIGPDEEPVAKASRQPARERAADPAPVRKSTVNLTEQVQKARDMQRRHMLAKAADYERLASKVWDHRMVRAYKERAEELRRHA